MSDPLCSRDGASSAHHCSFVDVHQDDPIACGPVQASQDVESSVRWIPRSARAERSVALSLSSHPVRMPVQPGPRPMAISPLLSSRDRCDPQSAQFRVIQLEVTVGSGTVRHTTDTRAELSAPGGARSVERRGLSHESLLCTGQPQAAAHEWLVGMHARQLLRELTSTGGGCWRCS